jgi:hypothetical protein
VSDAYSEYKLKFAKVNQKDPASVRKWFEDHNYLTINDHAMIIGKCLKIVRELRAFAGIKGKPPKTKKRPTDTTIKAVIELPDNWRTKEWLTETVKTYGSRATIRTIGCTPKRFYEIAKKLDVELPKSSKSKNPCCTSAWCHRHYVELGFSARKCAKLANITTSKFIDWLIKFKIQVISMYEREQLNKLPLTTRIAVSKLRSEECVRRINVYPTNIWVRYHYGKRVRYEYKRFNEEDWRLENVPNVVQEYEEGLLNNLEYENHIIISRSALNDASKLERNLAINRFVHTIVSRGWKWPRYPLAVLEEDLKNLKEAKENNFIRSGAFNVLHDRGAGRDIMIHYFDLSYYFDNIIKKPRIMHKVAVDLLNKECKFNTASYIMEFTRRNKLKMPNPSLYRFLLKRLGVRGKILDLCVGNGAHAIGCAMNNLEYVHLNDERFNRAVDLGFADFMHLKHKAYNNELVDLVLCDGDLEEHNIDEAMTYADRTKQILAYVPREKKREYEIKYRPRSIVKVITTPVPRDPNYYFLW